MKKCTLLSLSACLLLAAGCAPAPTEEPESAVGKVEDASAIVDIRQQYEAAENAGDAAAVAALWASDGILMPPNAPAIEGAQAIQGHYEEQLGRGKVDASIRGEETVMSGNLMSGNWGFERGSFSLRVTVAEGGVVEDKGKYIVLMTRQPDGGLKVARLIFNSDLPTPGSPGVAASR